jgi:hypothetical protein
MTDKRVWGHGSNSAGPSNASKEIHAVDGVRRRYDPPRLLSAEPLEAAATLCDGTGGLGKPTPPPFCSPGPPYGS